VIKTRACAWQAGVSGLVEKTVGLKDVSFQCDYEENYEYSQDDNIGNDFY